MQTCFSCSAEKDNCSFLISNSSFPQGRINPPIRGSIVFLRLLRCFSSPYQSPYKGFNRKDEDSPIKFDRINPPIRGSIETDKMTDQVEEYLYQSPYKGFNRKRHFFKMAVWKGRINPPIRGSIEQDNALFRNYKHKR